MNNFKLIDFKTSENIHKRVYTKTKSFSRSILHSQITDRYELQNNQIQLQENEIPIFETWTEPGYLLITTMFLYSNLEGQETSNYQIPIEDIIYNELIEDIIAERKQRTVYQECILKYIDTIIGDRIPVFVENGVMENILHEVLTQITWLCNKYKIQYINNINQ